MNTRSYQIQVIGQVWAGYDSTYEYTSPTMPDADVVRRMAGDFQSIVDYQVIRIEQSGTWARSVTVREVARGWSLPDSASIFLQGQGQG